MTFTPAAAGESAELAPPTATLCLMPLATRHEFGPESDLCDQVLRAAALPGGAPGSALRDGDILVLASKVVAKCEGQLVAVSETTLGPQRGDRPELPTRAELVERETRRVVARRRTEHGETRVVESVLGQVLAAAGIDSSNVPAGTALLLPRDCDASARALRRSITERTGINVGVLITDTNGRPWRLGIGDIALGVAGFDPLDDNRGRLDDHGRPMSVTIRGVADELAAATDLVKGKADRTPLALARGAACPPLLPPGEEPPLAGGGLHRIGADDWFAFGHVEAVRHGLGLADDEVEAPPLDPASDTPEASWTRALAVALAGPGRLPAAAWQVRLDPARAAVLASRTEPPTADDLIGLGVLAQRLETARRGEGAPAWLVEAKWPGRQAAPVCG
ncbi:coenzyme F420-0:L-glutamate ligase [Micrococcales bacterium 31B]|nr:coenzyme F420-0:L-glutamate ligase [Micrococcales bacterium 31B]